jgi:hypothetical protein
MCDRSTGGILCSISQDMDRAKAVPLGRQRPYGGDAPHKPNMVWVSRPVATWQRPMIFNSLQFLNTPTDA